MLARHAPTATFCFVALAALIWCAGCNGAEPTGTVDVSTPASLAGAAAKTPPKVMIIGLDGADLRDITTLWRQDRLPNLTKLMRAGVTSRLQTNANASPIVWTSVATGVQPPKHGIEFFRTVVTPGTKSRPAASSMRKRPAIWNILSHYDRTVGILGWWASFPAEKVNGYLVSPYVLLQPPRGTKPRVGPLWREGDPRKTYPPELQARLGSSMYLAGDIDLGKVPHLYADVERTTNTPWVLAKDWSYYEMATRQLREDPVETVAVYFQGIDAVSHDFDRWVHGKSIHKVREPKVTPEEVKKARARVHAMYVYSDDIVGALVAHASPETDVIVLSDHGWNYDGTSHWNWRDTPGVFIAAGPSFIPQGEIQGFSVVDVTPIVLTILGVPLSREFDGQVPEGLLCDEVMATQSWVDSYPIDPVALPEGTGTLVPEDELMVERLKALECLEGGK